MTKIISLDYMIGGTTVGPEGSYPCESIETQMNEIFKENPSYKYVDLVYKKSKSSNMEYATLIVEDK